jgi:pyruvate/2-oxoglutarate dehydrogenase complex dihydrolipoamide dehydrogenase (E3) component
MRSKIFDYDVAIIGSGSGGAVAAQSLAYARKKVAVIEADQSKAKVDNVTMIRGRAHFLNKHTVSIGKQRITAKKFIIATGTHDVAPEIDGLNGAGYITYKAAKTMKKTPESLFIVGGGATACELANHFQKLGSKIHMAEHANRLMPREDKEVGEFVIALFERDGIKVHTSVEVKKVEKRGNEKIVHIESDGKSHQVTVSEILVATGKSPNTDLGLTNAGVKYGRTGIKVNMKMQTSAKNIYAIGDVVGPHKFNHMAIYQSSLAVHNILHRDKVFAKYHAVPRCVFIEPEIACVGLTQAQAEQKALDLKISMVPIAGVAGFVKVMATKSKGKIVGASVVAPGAREMIQELTLAVNLDLTVDDVASTIHVFGSQSEAVRLACVRIQ